MFQDEARFGRMSDPRSCWAPSPIRPKVALALVREYLYAYAAVSPVDGSLDWMIAERMNTEMMNQFLDVIEDRYPKEHIAMVLDGASSHRSKDLIFRDHVSLIRLPPLSPELNPVELLWDELRENLPTKCLPRCLLLVAILTKFDVGATLLTSGLGTIIALLVTKRKIPMYYGSSFSYIAVIITAMSMYDRVNFTNPSIVYCPEGVRIVQVGILGTAIF
jgi:hypothetical protein